MTAPLVAKTPLDVDTIAREIARTARLARQMPPAWDGAKVAHGFTGTSGENLGRVLPGRGVALASDLKSLGITRPIPFVFEKSLAMRTIEACGGRERLAISLSAFLLSAKLGALGMADAVYSLPLMLGAITNYDGIINARSNGNGEDVTIYQASTGTVVAANWVSMIRTSPKFPAGTFAPSAIPGGQITNKTTTGALSFGLSNPSGTDKKYLITVGYTCSATLNQVMLVDILVAASGITGTGTAQTVNSTALNRYAGTASAGNLFTFEVTTQLGGTAANMTVTYTNSAGTGSRSTGAQVMTTSAAVSRLVPVTMGPYTPLQDGDIGVRSVESLTLSASMTAGAMNLYIYRPLHFLPGVGANVYVERDSTVQIDGLTELIEGTDSQLGCLNFFVMPNGTTTGNFTAFLRTVSG